MHPKSMPQICDNLTNSYQDYTWTTHKQAKGFGMISRDKNTIFQRGALEHAVNTYGGLGTRTDHEHGHPWEERWEVNGPASLLHPTG